MYKGISIDGRIDLIILSNILKNVPNGVEIEWYLEEIEGSGNLDSLGTSMLVLMNDTKKGKFGKKVTLEFILKLLPLIDSLDNFLLLGGNINSELLDFKKYQSVYSNVEYVFEFFDSMEWNITSLNSKFYQKVKKIIDASENTLNYSLLKEQDVPSQKPKD